MRSLCDYRLIIPWAVLGVSLLIWTLVSEPSLIIRRRQLGLLRRKSEDDEDATTITASSPSFDNNYSSSSYLLPNITVVIMNYNRPDVLQHSSLLPTLLRHPAVTEILLCHANPATSFSYDHAKVTNIDASIVNEQIGLALRFHYCRAAANEFVLHIDDDMEIVGTGGDHHQTNDDDAISVLQRHLARDPRRVVGHHARSYDYWRAPYRHGYRNDKGLYGPTPVVLTKFLMVHQNTCRSFFDYAYLMNDMALSSIPKWNGEDIFINLVATHINHGLLNQAVNVSVREATLVGETHAGVSGASLLATTVHAYYRGQFWATAVQRLHDATSVGEHTTDETTTTTT
jgi:Glycosyl transferase family 64 domain